MGMDSPEIDITHSPLVLSTWGQNGHSGFQTHQPLPQYLKGFENANSLVSIFAVERRTGQGDTPIPSLWAAVLDILARRLASFGIRDLYAVTRMGRDITIVLEIT